MTIVTIRHSYLNDNCVHLQGALPLELEKKSRKKMKIEYFKDENTEFTTHDVGRTRK